MIANNFCKLSFENSFPQLECADGAAEAAVSVETAPFEIS
jgi:hypothetical protein